MALKGKVATFAHLLGISAKAEEEDDKKKRDDETDDEYAKRMEDDEEAKKAEEEDKKEDDSDSSKKAEDETDKDEKDKKAKKAKSEDDGEVDEENDKEKEKAARKSERARCRAIFASEAAGSRPDVAAHLAFDTDMTIDAAVALLKVTASGQSARSGLSSRMSSVNLPSLGTDAAGPAPGSAGSVAAGILAAGKKRRGEV